MARGNGVLELAILGLLHRDALHGYELRKRLNAVLGPLRAISYGSLYPALRALQSAQLIATEDTAGSTEATRRSRIVYALTSEGKERLQELLDDAGPGAWEDETFGVHLAFFAQTDADVRMRILQGRRSRLEEQRETVSSALGKTRERVDSYTRALAEHGLESVEREVRWLDELIATERQAAPHD